MTLPDDEMATAVAAFRALASPTRLRIALLLMQGERAVGQIEEMLHIRQPGLSQQLAELREAGLIVPRREARSVIYALNGERTRAVLAAISDQRPHATATTRRDRPARNTERAAAAFAVIDGP